MSGALFISYSHADRRWLQLIRTHLDGALRGSGYKIWTDGNIRPGQTWKEVLDTALKGPGAALVLASPEYLVSEWCQRELSILKTMHAKRELSAIYWLMLRPCSWQFSGLSDLQAVHEPANAAIDATEPGPLRDQLVLDLCNRVTADLLRQGKHENPNVAFVRELMSSHDRPYRPTRELGKNRSDFSIVCQGLDRNDRDVVIKVLTNTPLHSLRDLFEQVSTLRKEHVADPSIIRVHDIFTVGEGHAARLVIVSDLAPESTLQKLLDAKQPLDVNTIGAVLRRLAEALAALHDCPAPTSTSLLDAPYQHVMGPLLPDNVFWDEHLHRPMISLVGITNFLWHFFEAGTFQRIVSPKSGTYIAPEKRPMPAAGPHTRPPDPMPAGPHTQPARPGFDQRVDQYFLGMLALELLEGQHVFGAAEMPQPLKLLENSTRPWKRHEQLAKLVQRLLAEQPAARFASMHQVATELRALEEPERVLAKYAYRTWIEPQSHAFSAAFYERFFQRDPSVRALFASRMPSPTPGTPLISDKHHQKLMDALVAVLNHRRGSSPSAIRHLVPLHSPLGISARQLHDFRESFIQTLEGVTHHPVPDPPAPAVQDVAKAWRWLFDPALDELASELKITGWPPPPSL